MTSGTAVHNDPKSRLGVWHVSRWLRAPMVVALSASLAGFTPRTARAADPPADAARVADERRSLAKAKYEEGVEAYRGARYADAVRLFLEADATLPSAALSYNIARAYEKLADDAQTLRWYRNYLRLSPQAANAAEVQGFVRGLSLALAKQGIQQLTVLTTPPGATVAIDGKPLGVTPLTVELRPGRHGVLLSRRGFTDFNGQFDLPSATPMDLSITLQAAAKVESTAAAHPETGRRFGIAPYLTLGAAALCLGSAGIFELSRRSAQDDAANEQVQLDYERDIDAMNSRQTSARVLLGVGGVLAVAGTTLLVFNKRLTPDSHAVVAGVPGGALLSLGRRF